MLILFNFQCFGKKSFTNTVIDILYVKQSGMSLSGLLAIIYLKLPSSHWTQTTTLGHTLNCWHKYKMDVVSQVWLNLVLALSANQRGKYHCTVDLLFYWFGISCMTTDNFCFYLQNRLIQTSQTGGQWYSDTSPLVFPIKFFPSTALARSRNGDSTNLHSETNGCDGVHLPLDPGSDLVGLVGELSSEGFVVLLLAELVLGPTF